MSVRQLIIDTVTIPVWATTEITQRYERLQAVDRKRTADGTGILRELWSGKLATSISGGGPAPTGLQNLDVNSSFSISCIAPLSITSTSTTITLPNNRRADTGAEPLAFAEVDTAMVPTTITNLAAILADTTDDATIQAVVGASRYQIRWFPILTVFAEPVTEDLTRGSGFGWTLEAEEV